MESVQSAVGWRASCTPKPDDANDWPRDWYKNLVIRIEAHLDERRDDESGHAIAEYMVAEDGYSMNERVVFDWAYQASQGFMIC